MEDLVRTFRDHVISLSNSTASFRHRSWFVKYHLEIVEKIALELCEKYRQADKNTVVVLVWLHDYGKILDFDTQYSRTLSSGAEKLRELGFRNDFVDRVIGLVDTLDKKDALDKPRVPIEVKIVSSADGAAHMIGPFFYMWWHENPSKSFEELMADNARKVRKDWDTKIVLPEVRDAFAARHAYLLEQTEEMPDKFL